MNPEIQRLLDELASTAGDPAHFDGAVVRLLAVLEDQLVKLGMRQGLQTLDQEVPASLRAVTLPDADHLELASALGAMALEHDPPVRARAAIGLLSAAHPFYAIEPAAKLLAEHHRQLDDQALRMLLVSLERLLDTPEDSQEHSHAGLVLTLHDPQRALREIAHERGGRETDAHWLHGDDIAALASNLTRRVEAVRAALHADGDS